MRFTFEPDQLLFRDAVREFLAKECTAADVRAVWDGEPGGADSRWAGLAAMGVVGLAAPEADGGLALDETSLVLLLEEAGRAALPETLADTAAVAVPALVEAGAHDWLARIAAGQARVAVAVGRATLVAAADRADLLILEQDGALYAAAPGAVRLTPQPSVDRARPAFTVEWGADVATRLDGADPATAFDRGALAAAAELVGTAHRMLEITADYARERHQFGVPIGSFQAVKHHLADALVALELARPAVYRASWSVAQADPQRSVHVSMAKALAGDAADLAARTALQVHGAIGYTWECDVHLWMKRAWVLGTAWGDAAWHRRRVATHVLAQP